jgi:hypothetical protein
MAQDARPLIPPGISVRNMMTMFQNRARVLSDPSRSAMHDRARRLIAAINSEWLHRRGTRIREDQYFIWQSTNTRKGHGGGLDSEAWIKEGLLQFMGYQVGMENKASQAWRERLLGEIFACHTLPVFPDDYIQEWSAPSSVGRLRKMAETLASLTRNARRRRDARMDSAIKDWESDLEFLYYEYYVGKFNFAWPTTKI